MDDFVVNVRQISQYPQGSPAPADAFLFQVGGLGGAYNWTNAAGLLAPLVNAAVTFGSLSLAGPLTWPGSVSMLGSGNGLTVFDSTGAPAFSVNSTTMWGAGDLSLPTGTVHLGQMPLDPMDAAPAQYVADNTVWKFNGRNGNINLLLSDITLSGGAPIQSPHFVDCPTAPTVAKASDASDRIATTGFVQAALRNMLNTYPFVYTFNGRWGVVTLNAADISAATATGTPTTPTPPMANYSQQIANTQWVNWQLEPIYDEIDKLQSEISGAEQFAPLNSPAFTGVPTAPTAGSGSSTGQIATTAFVMNAVANSVAGVATFNTRTGNVVLDQQDIIDANGWASPILTGTPLAPTAATGTASGQIATTGFVMNEINAIDAGVVTFNNRSGTVSLLPADVTGAGGALINSQAFTGTPTAPTATAGTNTTQLATCAFVMAAVNSSVASFNGRVGAVTLQGNDISAAGGALLAGPAFTGTPTAPTAPLATSTTQLATTAFVMNQMAAANIVASFNGRTGAVVLTPADITGTGNILISPASGNPTLTLNKSVATGSGVIYGQSVGVYRWGIQIGNGTAETGNNIGNDFEIDRFTDAGVVIGPAMTMSRTNNVGSNTTFYAYNMILQEPGLAAPCTLQWNNPSAAGTMQMYYNPTSAQCVWIQVSTFAQYVLAGNCQATPGGGGNFIVTSGAGFQPGGGMWSDFSDERIKTVVGDYDHGLAEILALQPVVCTYKDNEEDVFHAHVHRRAAEDKTRFITLLAQHTEQTMPEMVGKNPGYIDGVEVDDLRSLNATPLIYALVNAVKTLASRLDALETARTRKH